VGGVSFFDSAPEPDFGFEGSDPKSEESPTWPMPVPPERADDPDRRTNVPEPAPLSRKNRPGHGRTVPGRTLDLAGERDILSVFSDDLSGRGLAGERRLAKLVYLATTSRLLPWGTATNRPVSVLVRGSTSTGKSHAVKVTLDFFPFEATVDLGSMSKRFLFYDQESYEHRVLVVPEASQVVGDDELLALLRTLLSEGHVVHGTVTSEGRPTAVRITKAGPTALLMTTTRSYIDEELETRMLSVGSDDTPEQTRRVFDVYADLEENVEDGVDLERWHELQRWLEAGERRVVIPYVRRLGRLMPTGATRLRRDFVSMLCLVRAHALLHRATRQTDERGRIVATLDDYDAVRSLVGALIAEGVEAGVSLGVRQTVEAARTVLDDGRTFATPKQIQDALGVGRSATYDRIRAALKAGYLADESREDERGMKLVVGSPLPGDSETFLPSVLDIVRAPSEPHPDEATRLVDGDSGASSACPGRPTDSGDDEFEGLF
jgi:hypothetical protein